MNIWQKISSSFTDTSQSRRVLAVVAILGLLVAIPVTLTLVQSQQDIRQQAAGNNNNNKNNNNNNGNNNNNNKNNNGNNNNKNNNNNNGNNNNNKPKATATTIPVASIGPAKIGVTASASPTTITKSCPATITFTGNITSSGFGTTVTYRWVRSDGSIGPTQSAVFILPGTRAVATTWTLGANGNPTFNGWQKIEILTPSAVTSNQANFSLTCNDGSIVTMTPIVACTLDAKICPDGTTVGRTAPNCEFAACPGTTNTPTPSSTGAPTSVPGTPTVTPTGTNNNPLCILFPFLPGCPTPTPTTTGSPTPTPFNGTPVPTSPATGNGNMRTIGLQLFLHGIGKAGDIVNSGGGNQNPQTTERGVKVQFFDDDNLPAGIATGVVNYNSTTGSYNGTVSIPLPAGAYTALITTDNYIQATPRGIIKIQ